jgi:hypothetical protein
MFVLQYVGEIDSALITALGLTDKAAKEALEFIMGAFFPAAVGSAGGAAITTGAELVWYSAKQIASATSTCAQSAWGLTTSVVGVCGSFWRRVGVNVAEASEVLPIVTPQHN